MRHLFAKSSVIAIALWQGMVVEAGPDWIEDDHGDAGSFPNSSQVTQGSGVGGLSRISGSLGGAGALGLVGVQGDFEDMYLIRIDDPQSFCATTVPCGSGCGSATFDTQLWLFDANGFGLLGNNDTPIPGVLGAPLVTGSTLGPFACDETESSIPAPGLYYLAITQNNVPLNGGGPIFVFDDAGACGPGEVSGPDGPGGGLPIVEWTINSVDYDIQVLGGRAGDYATSFAIAGLGAPNAQTVSNQGLLTDPTPFGDWNIAWNFGSDADASNGQASIGSGFTIENTMPEMPDEDAGHLRFIVNLKLNVLSPELPSMVGGNAAVTLLTRPSALSSSGQLNSIEGPVWKGLINGEAAGSLFASPFMLEGTSTPISGSTTVTNGTLPVTQYNETIEDVGVRLEFELSAGEKATFNGVFAVLPVAEDVTGPSGSLPGQYVISLCGSSPAVTQVELPMDIKPGGCPNSFNPGSNGVLPVSILGTSSFDVGNVVLSSVRMSRPDGQGGSIGSVAPHEGPPGPHSTYTDTGTPFDGEGCACHNLGGDGITDLSMKFVSSEVAEELQLEDLPVGSNVEINLTGQLTGGGTFIARDCIRLVGNPNAAHMLTVRSSVPGAWVDVSAADIYMDEGGFGTFTRGYDESTQVMLSAPTPPEGYAFRGWRIKGVNRLFTTATLRLNLNGANRVVIPQYEQLPNSVIVDP